MLTVRDLDHIVLLEDEGVDLDTGKYCGTASPFRDFVI
jgi:hypothetical protein